MKRTLRVVGQSAEDGDVREPERLRVGHRHVTVRGLGSGSATSRFASFMVEAGAERSSEGASAEALSIVIRNGQASRATSVDDVEAGADYVLGSARPEFARRLVEMLAT